MSALRFVAWGMLNVDDVEDIISLEKAINEELEPDGLTIRPGRNRYGDVKRISWGSIKMRLFKNSELDYKLVGPPRGAKNHHLPHRTTGSLKECCAHALALVEPTSGGNP